MGQAGKALKQVLERHKITQNRLAVALGVGRSTIHRWINELQDPSAESVIAISKALQEIEPTVAEEFLRLYLGELMEQEEE